MAYNYLYGFQKNSKKLSPYQAISIYQQQQSNSTDLYTKINSALSTEKELKVGLRDKYKQLQETLPQQVQMDTSIDKQGSGYQTFNTKFSFGRKKKL